MAYCLNCRAKLEEDDIVCPFCGGETGGRGSLKQLSDELTLTLRTAFSTVDETEEMEAYDLKHHSIPALFAYFLPIPFLAVPFAVGKESEYSRFHAIQGLILVLCSLFSMGAVLLAGLVLKQIPLVGEVIAALVMALWCIAVALLYLCGLRNVLQKKAKTLPLIGRLRNFLG